MILLRSTPTGNYSGKGLRPESDMPVLWLMVAHIPVRHS